MEGTLALVGRLLGPGVHGLDPAVLSLLAGLVLGLAGTVGRQRLPETGSAFQYIKDSVEAGLRLTGLAGLLMLVCPVW